MKLSTAAGEFLRDARVHLAKSTQGNYESDLNLLVALATFHASDSVLEFTGDLVRLYFRELSRKGLSMATLHRRRATLNQFGKWGMRRRYWIANPADEAPPIRKPKRLPRPYSHEERARLAALPLNGVDAVIRGLLTYAGLRVTEACTLTLSNVSLGDGTTPGCLRIKGKGEKTRIVPLLPELHELLRDWMLEAPDPMNHRATVIQKKDGSPWSRRMVELRTQAWGKTANVPQCIPHRFRHSFATKLLELGANIVEIQRILGHADIGTTALYTEVVDSALVTAMMRLSNRPQIGTGGDAQITGKDSAPHREGAL